MINQITKVRLPDGGEVALTDWSSRPLYSNVDLLTGFTDSEIQAFNYTEGDSVSASANMPVASRRIATLRDTNIASANQMDTTEEYLVYAIKVEVHHFIRNTTSGVFAATGVGDPIPNGPLLSLLHNRLVLELEVSQKSFPLAGLGWFVQGFGPVLAVATPNAGAARTYANNGAQTHASADILPIPVHIGGTEDYRMILHNPPNGPDQTGNGAVTFPDEAGGDEANAVAMLRIYMCGLQKRATA
jgi:hypothetical protein